MSYSILTSYDRGAIETLNNLGYSLQKIADTLGFSKSTIHDELQRVQPYVTSLAQQDAEKSVNIVVEKQLCLVYKRI